MSVLINADTSDGLKFTSDTSGEIKLQSAGTDIATVSSSGIDVTGDFTIADKIIHSGDTNTAIRFPSADTVTVETAGTERMRIDSSGNVGIGTSSPNSKTEIVGRLALTDGGGASRYALNIESNNSGVGYTSINAYNYATSSGTSLTLNESGGVVLVGKTSDSLSVAGCRFESGGSHITRSGGIVCYFNRNTSTGTILSFNYNSSGVGTISTNGSTTSYNTSSDHRLKENNVNITDGITRVKLLKPYRFNFIADADTTVDGFYAHEVQSVVPEAITGTHNEVDDDGNPVYQGIDQSKLVPLLTAALQEAITKIEDLETRIQALENA